MGRIIFILVALAIAILGFYKFHSHKLPANTDNVHYSKAQDGPSPGLLVPTNESILSEFNQVKPEKEYSEYSYSVSYGLGGMHAEHLTFEEDFEKAYRAPEPLDYPGGHLPPKIIPFMYQGKAGYVVKDDVNFFDKSDAGHSGLQHTQPSYTLNWNDDGSLLKISLSRFDPGKYTEKTLITLLDTMRRVPGDSPKSDLAHPPVGLLVPSTATIPPNFKELWRQNTQFGYTVQYSSGVQRLTFDSWPGFKAGGDNLPNWYIEESAPGLGSLIEGSEDFAVNGIHGEIQTMSSRVGNKNVIYDLVWNDRGHKLRIIFGPVSQSAAMRQYVIGLISTMVPQPAANAVP